MKIAYLINVYKDFHQLERLVAKLNHDTVDFFIHVDSKVDNSLFYLLSDRLSKYNSTMVYTRVDVKWGGFSQVEATLNGLHTILESGNDYDYINLISGHDYPLKPNTFILEFLSKNKGCEFIEHSELSPNGWEVMVRFERYYLHEKINKYYIRRHIESLAKILPKRKFPKGYSAFGGSSWWTISSDLARYILNFVAHNKDFVNFFRLTMCPDEIFFQTIVMNSEYKTKVKNDNLRYIDWSEKKNNPKILSVDDYNVITSSEKLLARKFDTCLGEEVLDLLDIYLDNYNFLLLNHSMRSTMLFSYP